MHYLAGATQSAAIRTEGLRVSEWERMHAGSDASRDSLLFLSLVSLRMWFLPDSVHKPIDHFLLFLASGANRRGRQYGG